MSGDSSPKSIGFLRERLETIYKKYNRKENIHPDPLEFLLLYDRPEDREIVGLIASGLAYGRVASILNSTEKVLSIMGKSPCSYLKSADSGSIRADLRNFKHRFTSAGEMAALLSSLGQLQKEYGSLAYMMTELQNGVSYREALHLFVDKILTSAGVSRCSLLPRPSLGSACKRLHLFMRWMVRKDEVDPGGWDMIHPRDLIIPLDVHMHRAGTELGFTCRKSADRKTAEEVTDGFRRLCPEDPVRYDFAITRLGIGGKQRDFSTMVSKLDY